MLKYIGGVIILVILAVAGYYVWMFIQQAPTEEENTSTPQPTQMATTTYATTTLSLVYPSEFILDENYAYEGVPNKPIPGVKFTIPLGMATGTNLSSFDTGLSVESLPRAQRCTGDIYILENVRANELVENGTTYSLATTSGAGAGNLYEEHVYALADSSPCTAIRYFIHSTNIGNYLPAPGTDGQAGEPGAVREFDKNALLTIFDEIRHSLLLNP